jgi:hypothetical protein
MRDRARRRGRRAHLTVTDLREIPQVVEKLGRD